MQKSAWKRALGNARIFLDLEKHFSNKLFHDAPLAISKHPTKEGLRKRTCLICRKSITTSSSARPGVSYATFRYVPFLNYYGERTRLDVTESKLGKTPPCKRGPLPGAIVGSIVKAETSLA